MSTSRFEFKLWACAIVTSGNFRRPKPNSESRKNLLADLRFHISSNSFKSQNSTSENSLLPTRNIMEPESQYNRRWPSHKYLHVFVMLWFPRSGPSDCQTSSKIFLRPPRPLPSVTVLPTRDLRLNKSFLKNLRNAKKVLGCKEVLGVMSK